MDGQTVGTLEGCGEGIMEGSALGKGKVGANEG